MSEKKVDLNAINDELNALEWDPPLKKPSPAVVASLPVQEEDYILRLAACDVAALSNTRESYAATEIDRDNPAWSAAYGSVRAAVLREIEHRERVEALQAALLVLKDEMEHQALVSGQAAAEESDREARAYDDGYSESSKQWAAKVGQLRER